MANRVKFTPDGKRVLISDPPSNQVLVYDASSKELVKKIATNALPSGILIAPDGKRAYVACAGAGKIDVVDLDTLTVTASFATGNQPDGMAWAE
jgi:YVTN family beta-propeller protein